MVNHNHNGFGTGFRGNLRKARMVLQPLILAFPVVMLWHFVNYLGLHSTSKADEPIVNAVLPFIGSAHVFLAGFMLYREGMDISRIKLIVRQVIHQIDREKDESLLKEFLEVAEERIPQPLKYILLSTGTLVQLWTASLYYDSYIIGFASVYSVSYIVILIWEVIVDLDDPIHGVWVIKGIPETWAKKAHFEKRLVDKFFDQIFGQTN